VPEEAGDVSASTINFFGGNLIRIGKNWLDLGEIWEKIGKI